MATQINIEIDERDLKKLVLVHLSTLVGSPLQETDIHIEVKTTRNYRAEWEEGRFRASIKKVIV